MGGVGGEDEGVEVEEEVREVWVEEVGREVM